MAQTDRNSTSVQPDVMPRNRGCSAGGDRMGHVFSWTRVLRGIGCTLSALWLMMFHIGTLNQAPFRVPFRVKMSATVVAVFAVAVMVLCLRGSWRIWVGLPFALGASWSLWLYWA